MSTAGADICFVAPTAYAAIACRDDLPYVGGAQTQQVLIGRELARRGCGVRFVVLDHGQPDGIEHDGLRVHKMCAADDGWPGIRFIHPRWTSLWRALDRADARVVYQRGAGSETGQAAWWCRVHRRPFVFAAASNSDCDSRLPYLPHARERVLYRHGLHSADRVIAQTRDQVCAFRQAFGIDPHLIRGCSQDPGAPCRRKPVVRDRPMVLWAGRFSYEKRPEWVLELARHCPSIDFEVVGAANGTAAGECELAARAKAFPNVRLHGRVSHRCMGDFYARASVLLLTSMWEGFPNTFMEAWARGVPVVSTVDPDGLVAGHGLGAVAGSTGGLQLALERLVRDERAWGECSRRARQFFVENHTVRAAADAYESLLAELTGEPAAGPARPPALTSLEG